MNWLAVPGWEGKYEVSDQGRVRSLTRTISAQHPNGRPGLRTYHGRELALHETPKGYQHVCLSAQGKNPTHVYVHDLVSRVFIGPKPTGLEVCHNNGVPNDNRIENLRYDTRSANALDRHAHGTLLTGARSPQFKHGAYCGNKTALERVREEYNRKRRNLRAQERASLG